PDHDPGLTDDPFSARLSVADALGWIVILVLSSVGVTPEPVLLAASAAARVTEPDPVLVSCTCCVAGGLVTAPKENVAGLLNTVALAAAPASNSPFPMDCVSTTFPWSSCATIFALAVLTRADFTCAGVKPECCCLTSAAAPATTGA